MAAGRSHNLRRVLAVAGACFIATGCPPSSTPSRRAKPTMLASTNNIVPEPGGPTSVEEAPRYPMTAGELLQQGFVSFRSGEPRVASQAFAAAIATDELNDVGRALCYWHIAVAERHLGDDDRSAEALLSFITVTEDVLAERAENPFAGGRADVAENFDLIDRLAEARGYLAAAWARRADGYGRSMSEPVVVKSELEGQAFLAFAPPCEDAMDRDVVRRTVYEVGSVRVERANVSCLSDDITAPFYLLYVLPLHAAEDK